MTVDRNLLLEALRLTDVDHSMQRTAVQADCLMDSFVAQFVSESESIEGHNSTPREVLDSARDLVLV